jgi:transcription initiation factor TFIIB
MKIEDEKCGECGGLKFEETPDGYSSCVDCGLVSSTLSIDYGQDWRSYEDGSGQDSERAGPAKDILQHDYGITTEISPMTGGLSSAAKGKWGRLRHLDNRGRIRNSTERNLATALTELKRIASRMSLPKTTTKEAAFIYRKAVEKKLIRGRSIEGVVAASIYAACRMHNNPRTLDDVGRHSRTGRKEIGRTYRFLKRQLVLHIGLSHPDDYIPRFCSELQVPMAIQLEAQRILKKVEAAETMISRGPTGIAAAAIYLAAKINGKDKTQSEVAQVAGVTEVTIRNRYKELCLQLGLDSTDPTKNI